MKLHTYINKVSIMGKVEVEVEKKKNIKIKYIGGDWASFIHQN